MKKVYQSVFSIAILFFLFGCSKEQAEKKYQVYTIYTPVYKAKSDFFKEINGSPEQRIENSGKIYLKDKFIFLNEIDKGIHIIDNSDPSHPRQVAFLNIPGNQDIAVKGSYLYADMYSDLLTIDISNPKKAVVKHDLTNVFPARQYANGLAIFEDKIAVDWIKKDTLVEIPSIGWGCAACEYTTSASMPSPSSPSSNGVAGSMAKMVLIGNYIYAITESHSLGIVDVSNISLPALALNMSAGFDLETIFPFEDKLFLGSSTGMYMYDITNPLQPVALGEFSHGRACDPVIADGDYAYVTLHAGTSCGGNSNELNVINITHLQEPVLVKSYALTKPNGLCKDGDLLFICDGPDGVKIYNASKPEDLQLLNRISIENAYDVIAVKNIALVVTDRGFYEYSYADRENIKLLSFIATRN